MEDVPEFKRTPTRESDVDKKPIDDDVVVDEEKSVQTSDESEEASKVKVIEKAEEVALQASNCWLYYSSTLV